MTAAAVKGVSVAIASVEVLHSQQQQLAYSFTKEGYRSKIGGDYTYYTYAKWQFAELDNDNRHLFFTQTKEPEVPLEKEQAYELLQDKLLAKTVSKISSHLPLSQLLSVDATDDTPAPAAATFAGRILALLILRRLMIPTLLHVLIPHLLDHPKQTQPLKSPVPAQLVLLLYPQQQLLRWTQLLMLDRKALLLLEQKWHGRWQRHSSFSPQYILGRLLQNKPHQQKQFQINPAAHLLTKTTALQTQLQEISPANHPLTRKKKEKVSESAEGNFWIEHFEELRKWYKEALDNYATITAF
ncbi:hypothetical protein DFJ73DRAFT_757812 [Zopfochytrium polystomum]|nr:hypothetical protein DFJ73DRAFT_757812 [Zopfochytrium polystomum]